MRNPRVTNTTLALEWALTDKYTLTTTAAWSDSDYLRTGGFSSTAWGRNWAVNGRDEFGRSILTGERIDTTVNESFAHGSFSRGEYRQLSINLTRRFADRYQFFVNYAWSSNKDNAASERDTDTFFGPSDPIYINQDFGRNGLDIPHQFKVSGTVDVGGGWLIGGLAIARSANHIRPTFLPTPMGTESSTAASATIVRWSETRSCWNAIPSASRAFSRWTCASARPSSSRRQQCRAHRRLLQPARHREQVLQPQHLGRRRCRARWQAPGRRRRPHGHQVP